MPRVESGKRARPAAAAALRTSAATALPSPPPPPAADGRYQETEQDDETVDWAAEFEDVEAVEAERKEQTARSSTKGGRGSNGREKGVASKRSAPASSTSNTLRQQLTASNNGSTGPRPSHLQFDYHFLIPAPLPSNPPPSTAAVSALVESMRDALTTALSDRIHSLHIQPTADIRRQPASITLSLATSHPSASSSPFRTVDIGPEASSPAAADWRSYWSERSELRRFRDGRVLECVMWRAESAAELEEERTMGEASVLLRIVRWVVKRKGNVKDMSNIRFVGWQAHQLLKRRQLVSVRPLLFSSAPSLVSLTSDTASLQSTLTSLTSLLKSLSLPLSFTSITAAHPFFRYTDPFPPLPLSADLLRSSPSLPVIDVVAQFESSSAWPSSLYAIQQIKTAFVIELSSSLQSSNSPLIASTTVSYSHLDVLTAEPAAYFFRFHLLHHGELQPLSLLLHQSLRAFALRRGEGGVWAGLVCLAKRWVQCHMWGELIGAYVVELLCAAYWMEAGRGAEEVEESTAGESQQTATDASGGVCNPLVLLVGWLAWLGDFDFASGPLIVPLPATSASTSTSSSSSSFVSSSLSAAPSLFDCALAAYNTRKADTTASKPLPALYIATPVDLASSITSNHLSTTLLSRLQLTAASCASHLSSLIDRCELTGWMTAFKPDIANFDILVHLKLDVLSWDTLRTSVSRVRGASSDEEKEEAAASAVDEAHVRRKRVKGYKAPLDERKVELLRPHDVLLGVDVQSEYVRALQHQLGAYMDVHADKYGGTVVGVRKKQRATGKWKVKESGYTAWRVGSGSEGEWNVDEMLADIKLIGEGIVERVELQNSKGQSNAN